MRTKTGNIPAKEFQTQNETYSHKDWKFSFKKSGILPSQELDQWVDALKLNNIPEVVFGHSSALLINTKHDFAYEISPRDSLRFCNFDVRQNRLFTLQDAEKQVKFREVNHINVIPEEVKVKHYQIWKNKHIFGDPDLKEEIKQIQQISDPFYSTGYKGTVRNASLDTKKHEESISSECNRKIGQNEKDIHHKFSAEFTKDDIPVENLTEKNPIIWHSMIHMWEDELGDAGGTTSEFRFRVMNDCFFGLLRHYLRVDEVLIRIYDTRIYHDFKWNYIMREFQVREDSYENITKKGFNFTPQWMIDQGQSHLVYPHVEQRCIFKDKVFFQV